MKQINKLKQIIQAELKNKYGFAPSKNNIIIIDSNDDGTFILFNINDIKYRFYKSASKKLITRLV